MLVVADALQTVPPVLYLIVYVPAELLLRSIVPVFELILNPAGLDENVPPVEPEIVGVGSGCDKQYSVAGY